MNAPLRTLKKDPDANLDYAIDWSEWLSSATASGSTPIASTEAVAARASKEIDTGSGATTTGKTKAVAERRSDVVVTSTFAISPAGLTAGITHNDGLKTSIWLSGGSAGVTYTVTNHVVTEDGRTDDRSFEIVVVER